MISKASITATVITALALVANTEAAPAGCNGVRNTQPVLELTPTPLKTVNHGQSWKMEQDTNVLYIAKVSGTPYEMGYALGELYGPEIATNLQNMVDHGGKLFREYMMTEKGWQSQYWVDTLY